MKYFILICILITPAWGRTGGHLHEFNIHLEKKESKISEPENIKESSIYDFFDRKADDLTKKKGLIRNYNTTIHNPEQNDDCNKDKKENCK